MRWFSKADARSEQRKRVGKNGWTCHVCGDYRPDEQIGVVSTMRCVGPMEVTENVRYCRDRPSCLDGAMTKTWLGPNVEVTSRRVT